ncbi:transposase IS66 [Methylobacterium sp. AMS5]|nr:transposase IS66 [Methylobacterium sp. AMS5]
MMSDNPDAVVEHRPDRCACCGGALHGDLSAECVSVSERIKLPEVAPVVTQHRRLVVQCPTCGARVVAPVPGAARGTPFGPRLHAVATYLKTFKVLSYERLHGGLVGPVRSHPQPGWAVFRRGIRVLPHFWC